MKRFFSSPKRRDVTWQPSCLPFSCTRDYC